MRNRLPSPAAGRRLRLIALALCGFGAIASPATAGDAQLTSPPAASPAPAATEAAKPASALSALPAIPPGMARLVVIRTSSFRSALVKARVRVGGETVGWAGDGTVAVIDVAPGSLDVQFDNPLNFGHTGVEIVVAAGQTQFMQIKPTIYYLGLIGQADYQEMKAEHQVCQRDWCVDLLSADDGPVVAGNLPVTGPQAAKESK